MKSGGGVTTWSCCRHNAAGAWRFGDEFVKNGRSDVGMLVLAVVGCAIGRVRSLPLFVPARSTPNDTTQATSLDDDDDDDASNDEGGQTVKVHGLIESYDLNVVYSPSSTTLSLPTQTTTSSSVSTGRSSRAASA